MMSSVPAMMTLSNKLDSLPDMAAAMTSTCYRDRQFSVSDQEYDRKQSYLRKIENHE
jgi:NAD-dependent DNA ligase